MSAGVKAQYPGAVWYPHAHYWRGRAKHIPRYIILHGSASALVMDALDLARAYRDNHRDAGPHYIVGRDGLVVQCVAEENAAHSNGNVEYGADPWWGTRGNPNLETLSVEFVKGTSDNSQSLTQAQERAGFALIDYLARKWSIPPRWADSMGGVTGHYSIAPVNQRTCPGPIPWVDLIAFLGRAADAPFKATWVGGLSQVDPLESVLRSNLGQQGSDNVGDGPSGASTADAPAGGSPLGAGARAHQILQELPGFSGVVEGFDRALGVQAYDGNPLRYATGNALSLSLRMLLVLFGACLLIGLLIAQARSNDWIGQAGLDAPAFMMAARRTPRAPGSGVGAPANAPMGAPTGVAPGRVA